LFAVVVVELQCRRAAATGGGDARPGRRAAVGGAGIALNAGLRHRDDVRIDGLDRRHRLVDRLSVVQPAAVDVEGHDGELRFRMQRRAAETECRSEDGEDLEPES